ncbi:DUF1294 domain-containing protein [Paenibacillus sp. YN15]|uniref:DUF1294 domain-containing protein n=1 Tax=Paenibacillus sp. YN15 TaxID=1742774 RepID=UPI000DCC8722|nr:DUF1294 domain-containing protein [Paenibacillus sp. YN15]RAU93433.1 DUF1294 domain-containing protein [Paenibacillus sp. YN15]
MGIVVGAYLLVINLVGFGFMRTDKLRAKQKKYRIPEQRLFLTAILGGSVGILAGMQMYRHKTKHATFFVGIPIILAVQMVVAGYMLGRLLIES